jgi:hypothetical protein
MGDIIYSSICFYETIWLLTAQGTDAYNSYPWKKVPCTRDIQAHDDAACLQGGKDRIHFFLPPLFLLLVSLG